MSWFSIFGFRRRRRELQEEIDDHLRMAVADRTERGETAEAARQAALREFGNVALVQDVTRETWGWTRLERLGQDFRYSLRQMRHSPIFSAAVIGTLGLGIGAATAMFSVVDHVLLRPVAYKDAGRLVTILATSKEANGQYLSPWLDIQEWMRRSQSFQQIALWKRMEGRNFLQIKTDALQIEGVSISPDLFPMLGVKPVLGRAFLSGPPTFAAGRNAGSILLSYPIWQEAFGGDANVLGREVKINDAAYTVVGVMPRGFAFPLGAVQAGQVWVPAQLGKVDEGRVLTAMSYEVIGKLQERETLAAAHAEMTAIQETIAPEYTNPQTREEHSAVKLQRYGDSLVDSDQRKALLALLAASGVLWLIASLNVTNLLLARSTARQREIAMRGALGASQWRLAQQMMVDGLTLSAAAAALGTGMALGALKLLAHELTNELPLPVPATLDTWVLLVLLGLTVVSVLLSMAWPTLLAVRAPIEPMLRQGGLQAGTGRRQHRMRSALVTMEVAMSLTLLVACGLLLRTIYTLQQVPLGFRTDHIIVANLNIPSYRFAGRNMTETLYLPLLERVEHLHGTRAAGLISEVPLGQTYAEKVTLRTNGKAIPTYLKAVSPDVHEVFGLRMAAGRFFDADDTPRSQTVVVVNQAFARLYSPDKHDPAAILGTKLFGSNRDSHAGESAQIIGVLNDERQQTIADPAQPEIDICIPQITPQSMFYESTEGIEMDLAVRTDQPTTEIIPELRGILRHASPELANSTITTMDQIVADSYGSQRLAAHLLEIFGGSALVLSVAGLYGLLAYVVTQWSHEMGVRIALGAQRSNLLWLVMRQAEVMLVTGVAVGICLALIAGRLVRGVLYGVNPHDGWTLAGAIALMMASGSLAAYLPARRAASVNPIEALRAE
jgi:predicted permease